MELFVCGQGGVLVVVSGRFPGVGGVSEGVVGGCGICGGYVWDYCCELFDGVWESCKP